MGAGVWWRSASERMDNNAWVRSRCNVTMDHEASVFGLSVLPKVSSFDYLVCSYSPPPALASVRIVREYLEEEKEVSSMRIWIKYL